MAKIEQPGGDLARAVSHEPDQSWPDMVKVQIHWKDAEGRVSVRTRVISADEFFGTGSFGAPMNGDALIAIIELMRREGPPPVERRPASPRRKPRRSAAPDRGASKPKGGT